MVKSFDKKKYDIEYKKKYYAVFKVDLKKEELEELNSLLKKMNMTKADFLRKSIADLKKTL